MTIDPKYLGINGSIGSNYIPPSAFGKSGQDYPYEYTSIDNHQTSNWTIADALKIKYNEQTVTAPVLPYYFPVMNEWQMIWDTGCLRTMHCESVSYNGWYVIWSLTTTKTTLDPNQFANQWHNRDKTAFIGYWYSRDGVNWTFGGRLLNKSAEKRPQEWAGNLVIREGTQNVVDMFYTSVAGDGSTSVIAVSTGQIYTDDTKVWFEGFTETTDMLNTNGIIYATLEQDKYFYCRDPFPFINPGDGEVYCLFEGNVAGVRGSFTLTDNETGILPPGVTAGGGASYAAAAIGIAKLNHGSYATGTFDITQWTQLPPLISALGVNDQLGRNHLVFNGKYTYLFGASHQGTYSGGLQGPDGVYGFVSENGIFGPYEPLNGTGLVLGNPSSAPYEAYSHFVDSEGYVQYFMDTIPDPYRNGNTTIGASLGPTLKLEFEAANTYLTEIHGYGRIFVKRDWSDIWNLTKGNSAPWVLDGVTNA